MTSTVESIDARSLRLDRVIAEQERIFVDRQPRSAEYMGRARRALAGGVTSDWQITKPQPVSIAEGRGSKLYDVDGKEYVDLHGGYGAALAGHANPAIVAAVSDRVRRGTHFAQPTETIAVAENLAGRFGLPLWRYANSVTEATMEAIHLHAGDHRTRRILKVEGCYHGHHDSVQLSVMPELELAGPPGNPQQSQKAPGYPRSPTSSSWSASTTSARSSAPSPHVPERSPG